MNGTCKIDKTVSFTSGNKNRWKNDCTSGNLVNRKPVLCSWALDKATGHTLNETNKIEHFDKKKQQLQIMFLKQDDETIVDFGCETVPFKI